MDAPSYPKPPVNKCNIVLIISAIFFSVFDVIRDYTLGITYLVEGEYSYSICTAAFVYIPALINVYISERMYKQDLEMSSEPEMQKKYQSISSKLIQRRFCWPFVILIPLVPVLRCIDSLKYAQNVRKYKKSGDRSNELTNYTKMVKENEAIALLRVFECFLETAPQAILQLTILLQNYQQEFDYKKLLQIIGICTSVVIIGLTMANYNRVVRLVQKDKSDITEVGFVLQFLSHLMIAISRFVSVGVVASVWVFYTIIYIVLHWFAMTIWIFTEYPASAENLIRDRSRAPHTDLTLVEKVLSRMLAAVYGVIYIFVFINLSEVSTFYGRFRYYVICFIENSTACTLWAYFASSDITARWWYEFLIVLCIVPFFIGILFMIFYYIFTNVTKKEKPTFTIQINRTSDILRNYTPINEENKDLE